MRAAVLAMVTGAGLLAAFPAFAAPRDAGYPKEVRAVVAEARAACRAANGKRLATKPGAITRLDLNGDGRTDYIVDLKHVRCRGAEQLYCGTGGCDLTLLLAQPDGTLQTIFQGRVRSYAVAARQGSKPAPRTIRFDLHGSLCGRVGADECVKTQAITGEPFEFKETN